MKQGSRRSALSLHDEPFFREMNDETVARIEAFAYHREYDLRQIIYFPDDPCDYVYWVREGRVRVTRASGDGRELSFRHLLPGDMLGEECLGDQKRRHDHAEAMAATVLCLIRADDFRRLVREDIELANAVARTLCGRVTQLEQVLADTVFKSVRSRVASGLLRLYDRRKPEESGIVQVTHQELANLVGTTRETTTAMLHGLRSEGMIALANRRITVLDPIALEHLAENP